MAPRLLPMPFQTDQRCADRVIAGKLGPAKVEPQAQPALFVSFHEHFPQQRGGGYAARQQHIARAGCLRGGGKHAQHGSAQQAIDIRSRILRPRAPLDAAQQLRLRARKMTGDAVFYHADGKRALRRAAARQLFQMRPAGEGKPQLYADSVHQLPGVQIHGAAQRRERFAVVQQHVRRAAGKVQRHEAIALQPCSVLRGADMAALMRRQVQRHMQRRRKDAGVADAHLKNGHIAVPPVARRCGGTYAVNRRGGVLHDGGHLIGDLPHMRKHGLALAKAAFTRRNGKQASRLPGFARPAKRGGGGVAAGVQPQTIHQAFSSCVSGVLPPSTEESTPLMNLPACGESKRCASATASLMTTASGVWRR